MHPTADTFLSASRDRTARVWDLRSGACTGVVSVPNPPVVAYDRDA
jgi:COMPASS component SWD2